MFCMNLFRVIELCWVWLCRLIKMSVSGKISGLSLKSIIYSNGVDVGVSSSLR